MIHTTELTVHLRNIPTNSSQPPTAGVSPEPEEWGFLRVVEHLGFSLYNSGGRSLVSLYGQTRQDFLIVGENRMYENLAEEIERIKTNKFHLVDGPLSAVRQKLIEESELLVPQSYKQFVIQFGNAKFYRHDLSRYYLEVFNVPTNAETEDGEPLFYFGRGDSSWAYFKESQFVEGAESPVYEWRYNFGLRKTADGFEEWLEAKRRGARKHYKKKEWAAIEAGPLPFTSDEKAIVEARKKFHWRVVGVAADGRIQIEVHNGSNRVIPYLTIGVNKRNEGRFGGIRLPVHSVLPTETRLIESDCYKKYLSPEDVELFDEAEPGPEDREFYWEFAQSNSL